MKAPNLGSQNQFDKPIHQNITGVKVHGVGVNIYRTTDLLPGKSPDLIITIILEELKNFYLRHSCYPEEVFIQVDGGPENANQYVLGICELIAIKRLAKVVTFTRLPVGHTHEDVDALFKIIKLATAGICS